MPWSSPLLSRSASRGRRLPLPHFDLAGLRCVVALVVFLATLGASDARAQVFTNRDTFQAGVGAGLRLEDFESVPLDSNSLAAASNGAAFGNGSFTWTSTSIASDIAMEYPQGTPALSGSLLFTPPHPDETTPSIAGYPGGDVAGNFPGADDSFRLDFFEPVRAAGIQIYNNSFAAGESVSFFDEDDALLATADLPTGDGYVGYATETASRIAAIVVVEAADASGDDIRFDDVLWAPSIAQIYHSPNDDGQPGPIPAAFVFGATNTFNLWLETGPIATSNFLPNPVETCRNGPGDELCGFHVRIAATGDLQLTSFTPDAGVRGRVATDGLRVDIARANGAGDLGRIRLGQLTFSSTSGGDLRLDPDSLFVNARLERVGGEEEVIAAPEPGFLALLAVGLVGLVAFFRRRAPTMVAAVSLMIGTTLLPRIGEAQIYRTEAGFGNAVGNGIVESEDFEGYAVDGNGYAAIDNGTNFGAFSFESITHAMPFALNALGGTPTGLNGTGLVEVLTLLGGTKAISPGGSGVFGIPDPADDDDFRLVFDPPVRAVSLRFTGILNPDADMLEFRDASDQTIASTTVDEQTPFVAYVSLPPSPMIASVRLVDEADAGDYFVEEIAWSETVGLDPGPAFFPAPRLQEWRQFGAATPELAGAFGGGLTTNDRLGSASTPIGDLNGDGVMDAVVGAWQADGPSLGDEGAAFVLLLERSGGIRSARRISDSAGGLSGPGNPGGAMGSYAYFGMSATRLGDVDGDGTEDIAIVDAKQESGVYILFLRPDGTVRTFQRIDEDEGRVGGGGIGPLLSDDEPSLTRVEKVGDLDDDGRPEVAISAPYIDGVAQEGLVYIISLEPDGTFTPMSTLSASNADFATKIALATGDYFGSSLAAVGDLDGDGVEDLAVGAMLDNTTAPNAGVVWILFLRPDGQVKAAVKRPHPGAFEFASCLWGVGESSGDQFGRGLAWIPTPEGPHRGILSVGAPNFDAIDRCVVSGANYGRGLVAFLSVGPFGRGFPIGSIFRTDSSSGLTGAGAFEPPIGEERNFGSSLAYVGDLDDDGFVDLLVGAEEANTGGQSRTGAVYSISIGGTDPTAFADALVSSGGAAVVGPPNESGYYMIQGESFTLQFVDSFGRLSGDADPDLRIHLDPDVPDPTAPQDNTIRVEVSNDGLNYQNAGNFDLGAGDAVRDIDLDGGSIAPGTEIRFVRVTTIVGCVPVTFRFECLTLGAGVPRFDAVELLDSASPTQDTDFDGVADAFDNCRTVSNSTQADGDGDGWGDRCDVCPETSNPSQEFVCAPWSLELEGPYDVGSATQAGWDVYLRGGASTVDHANFGLIAPADTSVTSLQYVLDADPLGASCARPPSSQLGNSIVGGTGCPSPLNLDPRFDNTLSGVLRPSESAGFARRPDSLYVFLEASAPSVGFAEVDERVYAGRVIASYAAPGVPNVRDQLYFDLHVDELPPPGELDWGGSAGTAGDGDPIIEVQVGPAPGEPVGQALRWQVCVNSDRELNRLAFGVQWPIEPAELTGVSQMVFEGCETFASPSSPAPDYERVCGSGMSPNVDAANSQTWGPDPGAAAAPVLRIQVEGALLGTNIFTGGSMAGLNIPVLNAELGPGEYQCLGIVDFSGNIGSVTAAIEGVPPPIVVDGLELAPYLQPAVRVGEEDINALGTAAALDVQLEEVASATQQTAASDDVDGDGIRDEEDNCRFVANDGTNSGGLLAQTGTGDPFGRGDACECGDTNGSNAMLGGADDDVGLILDYIVGNAVAPDAVERCSVSDGEGCDIFDAALLAAGTAGRDVALEPACSAFLR